MTIEDSDLRATMLVLERAADALRTAAAALERHIGGAESEQHTSSGGLDVAHAVADDVQPQECRCVASTEPAVAAASVAMTISDRCRCVASTEPAVAAPAAGENSGGGRQMPGSRGDSATLDDARELLRLRGVALRGHHVAVPADEPLDRLAEELADGMERLGELPRILRRAATTQRPQTLRLRDEPAGDVRRITNLAARLHELGLLAHARYDRGARCLQLRSADAGHAFLAGAWLSRVAAVSLGRARDDAGLRPAVWRLVELHLPDGSSARLDVLGWTLDGRLLWLQTQSGAYQEQLNRCVHLRRVLRLDAEQCLLVLAGVSEDACRELSAIHGLTVTTVSSLDDVLRAALSPSIGADSHAEHVEDEGSSQEKAEELAEVRAGAAPAFNASDSDLLAAMLRRCGLRPRPAEAKPVLAAIFAAAKGGETTTARELRSAVADACGCSRGAVNDLLAALARGGGLLASDGSRAASLAGPFAGVAGNHADDLLEHCLEAYRTAIVAQDPTALGSARAQRALRALLGGSAP